MVRVRHAVRALLVTPSRELLLMQVREPESRRVFWITPGGGLEADERPTDGLRRELVEETGQADLALGPEVWTREHAHRWDGRDQVQRERFYLVRTPRFTPDPAGMPDAGEREAFLLYRWWTQEELIHSEELFAPRRLGLLLKELLDDGAPAAPVDVGI